MFSTFTVVDPTQPTKSEKSRPNPTQPMDNSDAAWSVCWVLINVTVRDRLVCAQRTSYETGLPILPGEGTVLTGHVPVTCDDRGDSCFLRAAGLARLLHCQFLAHVGNLRSGLARG